jgi:hypothetical protein
VAVAVGCGVALGNEVALGSGAEVGAAVGLGVAGLQAASKTASSRRWIHFFMSKLRFWRAGG